MTAALAVEGDIMSSSPSGREERAQKLANLFIGEMVPLLIQVRQDFVDKPDDEIVFNCRTWGQYCSTVLRYSERHIRRLIQGQNPAAKHDGSKGKFIGSPEPLYAAVRKEANERFKANPEKCFQRHMREVWGEREPHPLILSLDGARTVKISNEQAAEIILKYEWLGTMASGTIASYGLMLNEELLGVVCFGKNGSVEALETIHEDTKKVICLVRGACVPHAPKNTASNLIRYACKSAAKDFGWTHFLAYADEQAAEFGTVYAASNWKNIGKAEQGEKKNFTSPDGAVKISSYQFNEKNEDKFYLLGWDGQEGKYEFLRRLGYSEQTEAVKARWLWIEKAGREAEPRGGTRESGAPRLTQEEESEIYHIYETQGRETKKAGKAIKVYFDTNIKQLRDGKMSRVVAISLAKKHVCAL